MALRQAKADQVTVPNLSLGGLALPEGKPGTLPPVHLWNPSSCGRMDLTIKADGSWVHQGSKINRPALVRLFSTILRKDPEGYVLVTPVEKLGIEVEDAPFLAVGMETVGGQDGPVLRFVTNVEDVCEAGPDHALRFERGPSGGVKPYLHVRAGLWALLTRALTHDFMALGETRAIDGKNWFGIASGPEFYAIAQEDGTFGAH